jgi:hypothetical protein
MHGSPGGACAARPVGACTHGNSYLTVIVVFIPSAACWGSVQNSV